MSKLKLEILDGKRFNERLKLPPERKKEWLEALKSGEYTKTEGCLQDLYGYCCLGVWCNIIDLSKELQIVDKNIYGYFRQEDLEKIKNEDLNIETTALSPSFEGYDVLRENGDFEGFMLIDEENGNFYHSLAVLNDNVDSFDPIIEVIETYF